jgi:hypothetical protein
MFEEQLNQRLGLRPVASQRAVPASHAAVETIFAAEIRDLDHSPDKNLRPKLAGSTIGSSFVQGFLSGAASF